MNWPARPCCPRPSQPLRQRLFFSLQRRKIRESKFLFRRSPFFFQAVAGRPIWSAFRVPAICFHLQTGRATRGGRLFGPVGRSLPRRSPCLSPKGVLIIRLDKMVAEGSRRCPVCLDGERRDCERFLGLCLWRNRRDDSPGFATAALNARVRTTSIREEQEASG